eukprot:611226-Prymnesium_polylepis.1
MAPAEPMWNMWNTYSPCRKGTRVCVRVCVSARRGVWVVEGGGVPMGVVGYGVGKRYGRVATWHVYGTWRGRGSGGAHGRMDTW